MSFHFFMVLFVTHSFNFSVDFRLSIFLLVLVLLTSYLNVLPQPKSQRFTPIFYTKSYIVLALTFISLTHF